MFNDRITTYFVFAEYFFNEILCYGIEIRLIIFLKPNKENIFLCQKVNISFFFSRVDRTYGKKLSSDILNDFRRRLSSSRRKEEEKKLAFIQINNQLSRKIDTNLSLYV